MRNDSMDTVEHARALLRHAYGEEVYAQFVEESSGPGVWGTSCARVIALAGNEEIALIIFSLNLHTRKANWYLRYPAHASAVKEQEARLREAAQVLGLTLLIEMEEDFQKIDPALGQRQPIAWVEIGGRITVADYEADSAKTYYNNLLDTFRRCVTLVPSYTRHIREN